MAKKEDDWKEYLNPETKSILAEVLNDTKAHKGAYMNAQDVKVAQLWCAIADMKKHLEKLEKSQIRIEEPFRAIVEAGDAEKKKVIEKILREMIRPTDEATEKTTKELVETLMKF